MNPTVVSAQPQQLSTGKCVEASVKYKYAILNETEFENTIGKKPLQEHVRNKPAMWVRRFPVPLPEPHGNRKKPDKPQPTSEKVWLFPNFPGSHRTVSFKVRDTLELESFVLENREMQAEGQGALMYATAASETMRLPEHMPNMSTVEEMQSICGILPKVMPKQGQYQRQPSTDSCMPPPSQASGSNAGVTGSSVLALYSEVRQWQSMLRRTGLLRTSAFF